LKYSIPLLVGPTNVTESIFLTNLDRWVTQWFLIMSSEETSFVKISELSRQAGVTKDAFSRLGFIKPARQLVLHIGNIKPLVGDAEHDY